MMLIVAFHWFRACNKYHYAIMCVVSVAAAASATVLSLVLTTIVRPQYVTSIRHAMVAPLQRVWTEQRTNSMTGHDDSNVGHDLRQERMNRDTKQFVSAYVDIYDRLRKVAALLNAFDHVWPRLARAIGKGVRYQYERTDFKGSDKDKLLTALKAKLPAATIATLCVPARVNAFKSRPAHAVPPWDVVARAVTDGTKPTEDDDTLFVPPTGYDSDDDSAECRTAWYKYVTTYLTKVPRA